MRTEATTRPTERARARRPARGKLPFDAGDVIRRLRRATRRYTPAAMFQLADEGFGSVFEQLVACIISIRTYEEVTLPAARRLFDAARTPLQISRLSPAQIDGLIRTCTFHEPKARQIHAIAMRCVEEFGGELPAERDVVLGMRGVGPKCANLALGIGAGQPLGVPVDIHVHRVTNRWGVVSGRTPEQTMVELERVLPKKYWLEINRLLVPFGKFVCTARLPKCSACPVLEYCEQVGVTAHA
jgi:endonuclease-3